MSLPPIWKVRREVRRVKDQVQIKSTFLYEPSLRILHGRWLKNRAQPILGKVALGKKVAIFILFQPKGVANSIYFACDHLIAHGYSPVILSNAPLSESDRAALLERSALLLERPNFGYDFGAYQDGVHLLDRMNCKPDRLILMNDSTWFPLRENDTSIARMEASGDAFTGQVEKIEPDLPRRKTVDHLESHFLMFTKAALESDAYVTFWEKYRASSNRTNTIFRGEKTLSDVMFNAGFKSAGLVSRQQFIDCLKQLSYDHFVAALTEFCDVRKDTSSFVISLIQTAEDTPEWRQDAMQKLESLIVTHNFLLTTMLIFASMNYLGLGFVKKGNEKISHRTRLKVLTLASEGKIAPLNPAVMFEMEKSVANWTNAK